MKAELLANNNVVLNNLLFKIKKIFEYQQRMNVKSIFTQQIYI